MQEPFRQEIKLISLTGIVNELIHIFLHFISVVARLSLIRAKHSFIRSMCDIFLIFSQEYPVQSLQLAYSSFVPEYSVTCTHSDKSAPLIFILHRIRGSLSLSLSPNKLIRKRRLFFGTKTGRWSAGKPTRVCKEYDDGICRLLRLFYVAFSLSVCSSCV